MGTSSSTFQFNFSQYQYLQEILDPRFGEVKLYQKNETGELICVIEKIQTQPPKPFKKLEHPNLLKVHYYSASTFKEVCSTFTKLYIVYEYINNDLKTIISNRYKKQQYFTESQLWAIAYQILDVLNYLKRNAIFPMEMRNLYISNQGYLKFNSIFDNHMTSFQQVLSQFSEDFHISPEELSLFKNQSNFNNLNPEQCQIFQSGLTILWAASLNDPSTLFNKIELRLNEQDLYLRISDLQYTDNFKTFLIKMLQINPSERGTLDYLLHFTQKFEKNDDLLKIHKLDPIPNNHDIVPNNQDLIPNNHENDEYEYQSQSSQNQSNRKQKPNLQSNKILQFQKQISLIGSITLKSENQEINKNNQIFTNKLFQYDNQQDNNNFYQQQKSKSFLQFKTPDSSPIQTSRKPPSISASKNQLNSTSKPKIPNQYQLNKEKICDTSYFSQQSLLSNNKSQRSLLENRIEEALMKSKLALAKFDQTIKQNNYYKH
ncbi:unnamed protein product (macronuclear) [Paramecium tetraurelia]|uniref:non-specific serine/threonine protein kinase n=1 Tax=Paramecium tetraurelia TaxID=5888 RepID=A0CKU8_PARTE|nr:uncharacterized protein GSPATT00007961001 [Paramecium tetraurelia]CAK71415.1 unnamed protein product [Paramecium tetraurelia]|eukprot:XP_001438812.1 hypothetical protein (macronuclear) [Paramecium tetraurelia strain d4-2]